MSNRPFFRRFSKTDIMVVSSLTLVLAGVNALIVLKFMGMP